MLSSYEKNIREIYQQKPIVDYHSLDMLRDKNYQLLQQLIPHLAHIQADQMASSNQSSPDLYVLIKEKYRYTTQLILTHKFNEQVFKPDLKLNIYFDVKTIDTLSVCKNSIPNADHPYLNHCDDFSFKWELNLLTNHWLRYCLKQNYYWLSN